MYNFKNENHEYILFMDIEFDQLNLVQFCGILMRRIDGNNYTVYRSLNTYVRQYVSYYFTKFTGITNEFLEHNGVPLDQVQKQINEDLLEGVAPQDLEIVSHGVNGDLHILSENNIIIPHDITFCTFEKAKSILHRHRGLTLEDLCYEASVYPTLEHNAYIDAWLTVAAYGYLKDME